MKKIFSNSMSEEIEAWKMEDNETKLAGKYGLSLISRNFINPINNLSEEYVTCRKTPGVTVVPVLSNGNLIITRTFKHGVREIVWEFPAGMIDKNATGHADLQAKVELSEESGLVAGKMIYLGRTYVAPRKFDTYEQLYVALDCLMKDQGPTPGEGEILEVYEVTPKELWKEIFSLGGVFSGFSEIAAWRAASANYFALP